MKRVMDIGISLFLIILTSPIILLIAVIIRFKMGTPTLFKQQRPGKHGKPFYLYKFRTMDHLLDGQDKLLADGLRLTATGAFLRKYSLDELPQLINVIKGEMSLVGPRPLLLEYLALYTEGQRIRHHVKPGITGWAQVNGRNAITWEEKFKLDRWYVENQSFYLDVKILLLTVAKVIKKEGIAYQNHATMEKFTGSKEGL
jgi:sugar transferase EpsL